MPYYYNTDMLYIILLIGVMILGYAAQGLVNGTFNRYNQAPASTRKPAAQVAEELLEAGGSSVALEKVQGSLTDHFNPKTQIVGLSEAVYGSPSVAAIAVAAHEIGHVMQYERGYAPIRVRNAILPVAQLGSSLAPWIVIGGLLLGLFNLAIAGVVLFGVVFLFQIVTLPVEFNASSRAMEMLEAGGYVTYDESKQAKRVLRAAALTYVVAALASLTQLLRYLSLTRRSSRH